MELQQYSGMLDRVMGQEIISVTWSKTMDVCAILFVDNQLEICRVGEQLQRMFIIQEENIQQQSEISNICVENSFLAYTVGTKFYVYHLATHQRIVQQNLIKGSERIVQLLFLNVSLNVVKESEQLAAIVPLSTTNLKNWQNLCFLKSQQDNNIVFSLTKQSIHFNFNGILHLGEISIFDIITMKQFQNQLHAYSQEKMICYDLSQLQHSQILKYIQQLSLLNELLQFLKTSILLINTQLQDIYKVYQMNIIGPLLNFGTADNINSHILQFYQQGFCQQDLVNFFQKELYNTKILQKMDENITNSFNNIQEILQDSLMNVLQRILIILNFFIETKLIPYFQKLHKTPFYELQQTIKNIFKVFSRFQLECHETKLHLKNFFVWLNGCAIKAGNDSEGECENVNSPLNKIEVDLPKLFEFIKDIHLFSLKNLQCFYQEKISIQSSNIKGPKTFFTKIIQKESVEIQQTQNVNKMLSNIFQNTDTIFQKNTQNKIDIEEPFVTVNSLVRELQHYLDQILINVELEQITTIPIDLKNSILRFSDNQNSYQISVLKQNKIFQFIFQNNTISLQNTIEFSNRIIRELQYYQDHLILLNNKPSQSTQKFIFLTSEDETIENVFECHAIQGLEVSQRGLISLIADQKKLVILSV